jgi:hypothetical protein
VYFNRRPNYVVERDWIAFIIPEQHTIWRHELPYVELPTNVGLPKSSLKNGCDVKVLVRQ